MKILAVLLLITSGCKFFEDRIEEVEAPNVETTLTTQRPPSICEATFDSEVIDIINIMKEAKDSIRWNKYVAFIEKYDHCLDGAYAQTIQGISETSLADDWAGYVNFTKGKNLSQAAKFALENGYNVEMGLPENLNKIRENAKKDCPSHVEPFCKEILSQPKH